MVLQESCNECNAIHQDYSFLEINLRFRDKEMIFKSKIGNYC